MLYVQCTPFDLSNITLLAVLVVKENVDLRKKIQFIFRAKCNNKKEIYFMNFSINHFGQFWDINTVQFESIDRYS